MNFFEALSPSHKPLVSQISKHPLVKTGLYYVGTLTGTVMNSQTFMINHIFYLWFWLGGDFSLLSVPFYIPMIFITLAFDIYCWYYVFNNSTGTTYLFQQDLALAIIFFVLWLCLPLAFLNGLIFAIPTALIAYFAYADDTY